MEEAQSDVMAQPEMYYSTDFWMASSLMTAIFILLVVWSLVWKGLALWRAARNNHLGWYIALLILNTFGILEILYYFIWGKPKGEKPKMEKPATEPRPTE